MEMNKKLQCVLMTMKIVRKVADIIKSFLPEKYYAAIGTTEEEVFELVHELVEDWIINDMIAYAENDPAAKGDYNYVYSACKGFEALMYYRIAHMFVTSNRFSNGDSCQEYLRTLARQITEEAKVKTGIDINPACTIGQRCVIDHGVGTLIDGGIGYFWNTSVYGETAIIGDDCNILNDVIIGAYEVNQGQVDGIRHPKIGNRVTICSGARIFGPVVIGDNVHIGTKVIVCHDVPSGYAVTLKSQYQISKMSAADKIQTDDVWIDGIIEGDLEGTLLLGGRNLANIMISFVDSTTYEEFKVDEPIVILSNDGRKVLFKLPRNFKGNRNIMLKITKSNVVVSYFYCDILNRKF